MPSLKPGEYAIINRNWRYIHYKDDTEELYDLRKDPNEWYNLAGNSDYDKIKAKLRTAVPTTFAEPGPDRRQINLVVQGETFQWELKK